MSKNRLCHKYEIFFFSKIVQALITQSIKIKSHNNFIICINKIEIFLQTIDECEISLPSLITVHKRKKVNTDIRITIHFKFISNVSIVHGLNSSPVSLHIYLIAANILFH